jgi:hypothetical protein
MGCAMSPGALALTILLRQRRGGLADLDPAVDKAFHLEDPCHVGCWW